MPVWVVDNASSDRTVELVRTAGGRAELIVNERNLGFAAANNRAAELAQGDWLVFLNPDAYAEENWLQRLVDASRRRPGVDAFGSLQLNAGDPTVIDGAGDVLHAFGIAYRGHFGWPASTAPDEGECFSACAAAAMYRKSEFDALGGFDESFFCYGEDVDLGMRLRMKGGRSVQVADAHVLHEGSAITGRHSAFTVYHGHRNRIWLVRKNFPSLLYWGGIPLRLALDLALLFKMALIGEASVYVRALRDGYFGGGQIRKSNSVNRRRSKMNARELAVLMAWSPVSLIRRKTNLRPISGDLHSIR